MLSLIAFVTLSILENLSLGHIPISHVFTANELLELHLLEDLLSVYEAEANSALYAALYGQQLEQFQEDEERRPTFSVFKVI